MVGSAKGPLLETTGIHKVFPGTHALTDVSLKVYRGEVHTIMGENGAGKSTLMNILSGVFPPTKGKILLEGEAVSFNNPREAQERGIAIVHQELSLCSHLSVSENIFMGRMPQKWGGFLDKKSLFEKTTDLLKAFHATIYPDDLVETLSVSEQQIVEIAKALSMNCKVLILDEPTSAITESEADVLFDLIRELKKKGIAIIYISHKFNEIFNISDRITVLRDGHYIDTQKVEDLTPDKVVSLMVGRNIENVYPEKADKIGKEILKVKNLSQKGLFSNIDFSLYENEILGIFGLIGAGRTEMSKAICGIAPKDHGNILIDGSEVKINSINDAKNHGLVYLTEDRKTEGLFLEMSIKKNIVSPILNMITSGIFVNNQKESDTAKKFTSLLNVRMSDINQKMGSLSGGNQQKAMVAEWLSLNPRILIMDEPTRGIDVGAKSEIYKLLRNLSDQKKGVIMISSELPEIIGVCDRVLVMHQGQIVGELSGEDLNEEKIMRYASGIKEAEK